MINLSNVADSVSILIKDNSTFERLKTDFPDILADLVTFKDNPNCSCRGRVFKFFTEKVEQTPDILNKYIYDPEVLSRELQLINNQRLENNYAGKIMSVEKTEQAWRDFTNSLAGKTFRNFSVAERETSVMVYFL